MLTELKRVRARIAKGWCRGSSAKDSLGFEVSAFNDQAVQFCLLGAIYREGASPVIPVLAELINAKRGCPFLAEFNDTTNKQAVLELLDEAITKCSGDK